VIDSGHLDDDELVELAVQSGARRIVCSHLYRDLDAEALGSRAAARGFCGEILVGRDLMIFPLKDE
jgi:ribonuclease BN (tRNA processing enzyme)